jgi:hypothetical protein
LTKQADEFLGALDERICAQLKSTLDAEIWESVAVPREFQALVDRIEAGRVLGEDGEEDLGGGGPATLAAGETRCAPSAPAPPNPPWRAGASRLTTGRSRPRARP